MLRRFGAAVAVLTIVCGSSTAPYTHAHHAIDSVSDERHPHGDTLVHTHASPHSHHDADQSEPEPAGKEEGDEQLWTVNSFVFHQLVPSHAPSPVLLVFGQPDVQLTSIWVRAPLTQPKAHGPPLGPPSGLRAPPAYLPELA